MISKKDFKLIYHEWNNLNDNQKINLLMNLKNNSNTDISSINQMVEKYSSNHILTIFKHVLVGGGKKKRNLKQNLQIKHLKIQQKKDLHHLKQKLKKLQVLKKFYLIPMLIIK